MIVWLEILFACLFFFSILTSLLGWRNSTYYSKKALEIGEVLKQIKGEIETDDAAFARICKMSVEEYRTERAKGRALYCVGSEVCGIAEGLKAPFRFWR